jgi:diguanylate cyclase (GGDEF)-like protein
MTDQITPARPKFARFTLVQKLVASYAAMILFTIAALLYTVTGLYSIHKTAREIAQKDFPFFSAATKLRDSMVAQERYAGRYAILKGPEFKKLFQNRETEFLAILAQMQKDNDIRDLASLAKEYQEFRKAAYLLFQGNSNGLFTLKVTAENVATSLSNLYANQQDVLSAKLEATDNKEKSTVQWAFALSLTGFALAICVAAFFIFNISSAINKLKRATLRIAEGDFDFDPQIPAGDEIGDLARDFTRMAARLKVLEQMSLDASPLTRLPGNIAIERVLNQRLHDGGLFAVCYADLDNFKAYNDRYGYIKGSEVIKMTGEIIYEETKRHSDDNAFIGHVGGDDFVMVVTADHATPICEAVIRVFTEKIVEHYCDEDVARGAIDGVDRYGVQRIFPIMTISIAVIICQQDENDSAAEIAKNAAEIKDYVKVTAGSNFLINRRKKLR